MEIYFSLVQREVLVPNDFASLEQVVQRIRLYEELTNRQSRPFRWEFDRVELAQWLERLEPKRVLSAET